VDLLATAANPWLVLADGRSLRLDATSLNASNTEDADTSLGLGPNDQIGELVPPLS
jgi:hypothetical protein